MAASKDVIRDPLPLSPRSSSFSSSEEEEKLVRELISDCYLHHRRGYFGSLPPENCKLVDYTAGLEKSNDLLVVIISLSLSHTLTHFSCF